MEQEDAKITPQGGVSNDNDSEKVEEVEPAQELKSNDQSDKNSVNVDDANIAAIELNNIKDSGEPIPVQAEGVLTSADVKPQDEIALEVPTGMVEEEVVKRDPNLVSLTLRPVDKDWVMGEDWVVDLHNQTTMVEIKQYVETHRGISRHRIQLRMKGKVCPTNREIWTLRRLGIYDGYVIQVEPTLSGAWLWNPKEYYINKLLDEVSAIIESTTSAGSAGRINLKHLNAKIKPPPCIKTSLRVFLRQYPERIYMHTDTTEGDIWVHVTKRPFQLPTFGNFSVEIGTFAYYKPKKFDWAGNKDIDDMYKIETLPEEEEVLLVETTESGAEGVNQSQKEQLAAEANARLVAMGDGDTVEDTENNVDTANTNENESTVTGPTAEPVPE